MSMSSFRVISSSIIQAASHNNGDSTTQKIDLTPWDLQFLPLETIQKGLLFHHSNLVDTSNQIQHLKHSLSSTLSFFPPFAGRLVITEHEDNTATCFLACNNLGAVFVHAVADNTTVSDILPPDNYVPPIVQHSFFPLNGVKNYEGTTQPLLAVQVTELLDGIFIGLTVNHVVADGKSFWLFVNSWAEISRGSQQISKYPVPKPWFLNDVDRPIRFPFKIDKVEQMQQHIQNANLRERIFHFTKEKIAELKSKARVEARTEKISSLQAVLAHLWRSVIRCKRLDPQEEVRYLFIIGVRPRLIPPLEEDYFGNAAVVDGVTMKVGELLEGGLGNVAWEMNKLISLYSVEKIKKHYETWLRTPQLVSMGSLTSGNSLSTSSSPRFNVYGNDFGWGKPVAVRSGSANKRDGKITVFAGAEEGSIDIEVCLPYEISEVVGKDLEFL